ncbi:uncharacterized protein LTR77_003846 [Saxophila tyrrhenica]|uniref:Major facilitator superfamily (MFS) profile domain-containing protein n=1 Tax=Saxophila tyrrhenica TaxID=1690608 RepID=A0AAV9PET3_9PEZI|nr:hypothetical protein LTR77_003846 [Saxophila tyrrhenica]
MSSAASIMSLEKAEKKEEPSATPLPLPTDVEKQQPEQPPAQPEYVTGFKLWTMMAGVTLVCFLMLLDISIVSTATPKITSDFHSLTNVGWYGAAYQLASATLQPLTGKIYTQFNLKWSFFAFFLVFEIGSLLCGVATSSNMLIVGRAVAGIGGSGLQNGAITIITNASPMHKRPMLLGVVIGFGQLGLVAGPLIGGVLTEFASWRWCFYINLPLGAVVAALLVFTPVPESIPKPPARSVLPTLHHKLDLVGFSIFAPAAIMLLLAVQWGGNAYPWDSSVVIGLLCGSVATALVWGVWNYRKGDDAMLPFPMLRRRNVWTSCLVGGSLGAAMYCNSYYLPIYFQGVRNKSPAISGVYLLPSILSQLISGVAVGKLMGVFGYYLPWGVASGALQAIGYGLLSTLHPHSSAGAWIGYQIIAGIGRGFAMTIPFIAIQNTLQPAQIPVAMSLAIAAQTFFGAVFLSFADTIFTNSLRSLVASTVGSANAATVAHAGAYAFRRVVPKGDLADVLVAYSKSIDRVFYMCVGLAGACFVSSWGLGWVDIRQNKPKKAEEAREK